MDFDIRELTFEEEALLEVLIQKASIKFPPDWKEDLLVQPMDDGGMGGLHLHPYGIIIEDRLFGEEVSEHQFSDVDGVTVITLLNVDSNGALYELDIWKTDFSPLIHIPAF